MCKKIVFLLITLLFLALPLGAVGKRPAGPAPASKKFTLVIDAGHGGGDTGACGAVAKEKNLTLKFALAFGELVERNCPDVKIIYTRKTDRFVELYRRAEIANQNKADLFISIHINALPKGHIARGFQTYTLGRSKRTGKRTGVLENLEVAKRENAVIFLEKDYRQTYQGLDPNSPESNIMFEFIQDKNMERSVELARYMQRYVCQATGRQDMGAQQDNLAVLRLTSMPGCLIELGFISTRDEEQYMNSSAATKAYARGIYNAFAAYKKRFGGGSITVPYMAAAEPETVAIPQVVPSRAETRTESRSESRRDTRREAKADPKAETKPDARQESSQEQSRSQEPERPTDIPAGLDLSVVRDNAAPKPAPAPKPAADVKPAPKATPAPKPAADVKPAPAAVSEPVPAPVSPLAAVPVSEPAAQPAASQPVSQPAPQPAPLAVAAEEPSDAPVFKIQILASSTRLDAADKRLKGVKAVDFFQEGGMYKYTVGASTNYNEVYRLRKELLPQFPQAFIIAFRQGQKMSVQEAIREFLSRKKKS